MILSPNKAAKNHLPLIKCSFHFRTLFRWWTMLNQHCSQWLIGTIWCQMELDENYGNGLTKNSKKSIPKCHPQKFTTTQQKSNKNKQFVECCCVCNFMCYFACCVIYCYLPQIYTTCKTTCSTVGRKSEKKYSNCSSPKQTCYLIYFRCSCITFLFKKEKTGKTENEIHFAHVIASSHNLNRKLEDLNVTFLTGFIYPATKVKKEIDDRFRILAQTPEPNVIKFPQGVTHLPLTASKDMQAVLEMLPFVLHKLFASKSNNNPWSNWTWKCVHGGGHAQNRKERLQLL